MTRGNEMTDEERQLVLSALLDPEARERRRLDDLWDALLAGDTKAAQALTRRRRGRA